MSEAQDNSGNVRLNERLGALRSALDGLAFYAHQEGLEGVDVGSSIPIGRWIKDAMEIGTAMQAERDRYRKALERLSREAPIGDYMADVYSELNNSLLIEELNQRADFAREALKFDA